MLSTKLKSKISSVKNSKGEDGGEQEEMRVSRKPNRNEYSRPCFLELTEDEFQASKDHETRPIIVPKRVSSLPWNAGYAECVGAHAKLNEDQAAVGNFPLSHELTPDQNKACTWGSQRHEPRLDAVFYGVFDGHGGSGAALMVANQLVNHLQEKLVDVSKELLELAVKHDRGQTQSQSQSQSQVSDDQSPVPVNTPSGDADLKCEQHSPVPNDATPSEATPPEATTPMEQAIPSRSARTLELVRDTTRPLDPPTLAGGVTFDDLVIGALEAAFYSMDKQIAAEMGSFNISGGCCTLVALFLHGKVYVANAGDCRAVAYLGDQVIPLSTDFSADQDSHRIYALASRQPELTQGQFAVSQFRCPIDKTDIGAKKLWRPPGTVGWSKKVVIHSDVGYPLIKLMKGNKSRLMGCIAVSRCLGDHDLIEEHSKLHVKPFLSCTPEVQVLDLSGRPLTSNDVLVMGSDGLWDMVSNGVMGEVVGQALTSAGQQEDRYNQAARAAVLKARGEPNSSPFGWRGEHSSLDDITAFVIPLHHALHATRLKLLSASDHS